MKYEPHDYQQFTTNYICTHPQAAIFLGMGLGKTVLTLTAINELLYDYFDATKVLIIAPLRVARDTWPTEIHKWDHLHNLDYSVILGTPAQRRAATNQDADIYIINRENIPWLVDHHGKHWPYDMVVIDELSSFKNHKAQRFKKLLKVRPYIHRIIGLTGTPAPNSLLDIWAPFRLLDGGHRLGQFITHYRNRYFTPGKRNGHQVYEWKLKPGADEDIYTRIEDMTVSMRTTDYLTLPKVTYTSRDVTLAPKQRALYDTLKRDMVATLDGQIIDAGSAGTLSGKLQQLSSGALYTHDDATGYRTGWQDIHPAKLDALGDIIDAAAGQTILVAYWFEHEKQRILAAYPQAVSLETADNFTDWNHGRIPIGLIHPASAGHGLNLQTGGHILVWMTTPWSLELYEQTNARLHRQGQTEPVSIIHINTRGTIDERVHQALTTKSDIQQQLISAVAAELGTPE